MSDTYITEEMRRMLNVERDVMISPPISENDIRKWAIAVYWPETPPQQYWDAAYANTTRWGGLIAPEEFNPFAWPIERREATRIGGPQGKEPGQRGMNGSSEAHYHNPMRPGDVIRSSTQLLPTTSTSPSPSRSTGRMLIGTRARPRRVSRQARGSEARPSSRK